MCMIMPLKPPGILKTDTQTPNELFPLQLAT